MPQSDTVASIGAWMLENGHRAILAVTGGRWPRNLVVNPDVEITIDGETRAMRARTASSEERDELWTQITSQFRNCADYQASTDREIPVVVCEPA